MTGSKKVIKRILKPGLSQDMAHPDTVVNVSIPTRYALEFSNANFFVTISLLLFSRDSKRNMSEKRFNRFLSVRKKGSSQ